jgi:glycosyltransferase involved in cell wall biosynthesis
MAHVHILFTRFPLESAFGGAERQTVDLAKGLREKGHEVSFLGSCPSLLRAFREEGFHATTLDIGSPPVTKWGAVTFLWRQYEMKRKLREAIVSLDRRDDMVIFMLSLTEKILLTGFAVQSGIKVFWIEHDRVGRWLTMNPWLPKLRRLSRKVKTVVVSDLGKRVYVKLGWRAEDVVAIPNGIDMERFTHKMLRRAQHDTSLLRIGCIARLSYEKGIDLLIEAAKDLPNITLTIIGTGPEEERLKRQAERMNRIHFVPHIDNLQRFYREIDCLVLPSRDHDPFGLVVVEAMAAGVPTICTDACGIASHLSGDESLIVEAGSSKALREAIEQMNHSEVRTKLATIGPKVVRERFTVEKMVEAYEILLSSLY